MINKPGYEDVQKVKGTLEVFNLCEDCFYWYHPDQRECMDCEVHKEIVRLEG
jgi:uncharacterized OB-fold protein